MAQVVIFAPPGEDVSTGEEALKAAGHEVEIVEATAANLLHMAIGMMEEPAEEEPPAEEAPVTEPTEEAPAEEPPAEEAPAEEPTVEAVGHVVTVDGEKIATYIDPTAKFPLLRVVDLTGDSKLTYKLHESTFSYWRDAGNSPTIKVEGKAGKQCKVKMGKAKTKPHLVLDEATAKHLGLQ